MNIQLFTGRNQSIWHMCLLLTTLLMLVACGRSAAGVQPDVTTAPSPMGTSPTVDIYATYGDKHLIEQAEALLQTPELSQESRRLIEDGLAYQKQQAERRATAVAQGATRPRPGDPEYVTPIVPTARPSPTAGIFTIRIPPPFYREYNLTTTWRHYEGAGSLLLLAGAPKDDPAQGVLLEWRIPAPGRAPQSARYATPTRSGSVRILAEQNGQLTLEAENGDLFVFDVATRRFVDDPPAPTPTVDEALMDTEGGLGVPYANVRKSGGANNPRRRNGSGDSASQSARRRFMRVAASSKNIGSGTASISRVHAGAV